MERQGFEGRVTFNLSPNVNMRTLIVRDGFQRAIPEHITFTGVAADLFSNIQEMIGRTNNIQFMPDEEDDIILSFKAFWKMAQYSANYREIWQEFTALDVSVNNQWIEVINSTEDRKLKSPIEVQPGSPSDDELLENGSPEALDFLAAEESTLVG